MTTEQIEQRLAKLEQTVAKIDEKLDQLIPSAAKRPWWKDAVGKFANDPIFDEMVKYGREYRESLRPRDDEGTDGPLGLLFPRLERTRADGPGWVNSWPFGPESCEHP